MLFKSKGRTRRDCCRSLFWEKFYVGTGLVPVLTLMRTATRAVPTSTTPDSIYHFYELSNGPRRFAPTENSRPTLPSTWVCGRPREGRPYNSSSKFERSGCDRRPPQAGQTRRKNLSVGSRRLYVCVIFSLSLP